MCLALPGQLLETDSAEPLLRSGNVDFNGIVKNVSLACVPEARPGDYVIVHAGLAIAIIDPQEARLTLQAFADMDTLMDTPGDPA
ncbi:MAG: HypC/HybG/HupF family hydrogenase formation chaperone [Methylomonas sp.]|nr:HypC/HybG/HupF family hydrogenase formation chaperone [Methylomonas sp.]PPD20587.1 MAG: HypC/HybG/HupF family hydrogenase formation chaperone [Methylomonas sp.]PPD25635.1 MAG: HypC/HybG/HupF family hydrogenase formation chaperone [Methylomonas sp.]PPD36622.1 MAG: HypC/HybG/HupF family hydrogenase formation chaperone [Methylomonas sp.]PPD42812.1 MAG: HypC/HybG/HupF family hydrogenase formation chaperone [Methylomonas sp.]